MSNIGGSSINQNQSQVFTVNGIDGEKIGPIAIFTPTAKFTPLNIVFELTAVKAFVSVPSCSVGTNAALYDNLLSISPLTGIQAQGNFLNFSLTALLGTVAAGTPILLNITTPAVATIYTMKVTIFGFYN